MSPTDKHRLTGFESLTLNRRSDELSEQFSTPSDPRFWIRIELPLSSRVLVTDLLFGEQDEYVIASALSQALTVLGVSKPTEIVFSNLGPVGDGKTTEDAQKVERVVEAMVMQRRRFIIGRDYEIVRDKVDLVFRFKIFE